jgi:hypothetical protein
VLVATGWESEGRYSVPWFQFANGQRINLFFLPDGPDRWRRMYQR